MKKFFLAAVLTLGLFSMAEALRYMPPEIPKDCTSWFDGCNTCTAENGVLGACTLRYCEPGTGGSPECQRYEEDEIEPVEIPYDCISWYDGCNSCGAWNGQLQMCTEMHCDDYQLKEPYCAQYRDPDYVEPEPDPEPPYVPLHDDIPENCETWYDGCNTCGVEDGELTYCTERACFGDTGEPYCSSYHKAEPPNPKPLPPVRVTPDTDWPANCEVWFDGCNTCQISEEGMAACTRKACFLAAPSECLQYRSTADGFIPPLKKPVLVEKPTITETSVRSLLINPSDLIEPPVRVEIEPIVLPTPTAQRPTPIKPPQSPSTEPEKPRDDTGQFSLPEAVLEEPVQPYFETGDIPTEDAAANTGIWSFIKRLFGW